MHLRCGVAYALEGAVRRELQAAGATLGAVHHGSQVEIAFGVAQDVAPVLRARLGDLSQGAIAWLEEGPPRADS